MAKPRIEDTVREMIEPIVSSLDLELVDIEYVKEGGSWFLRVFIDRPGGITHDDCQAVSNKVSDLLDDKDPIPQSYILEVSSPGIERPLKKPEDFARFSGRTVRATTFAPVDGQKEFVGRLEGLEGDDIIIDVKGKRLALPQQQVARVRLEAEF